MPPRARHHVGQFWYINDGCATSSRLLKMPWRQIGNRPSATTKRTRLYLYCHMSHIAWHRNRVTTIKQTMFGRGQAVGNLLVSFLLAGCLLTTITLQALLTAEMVLVYEGPNCHCHNWISLCWNNPAIIYAHDANQMVHKTRLMTKATGVKRMATKHGISQLKWEFRWTSDIQSFKIVCA